MTGKRDKPVTRVSERRQAYTAAPVKTNQLIKTIEELRKDNSELSARLKMLEERLLKVETALPEGKVIVLREISREGAEKEILGLFSKGETLYYSDIAEILNLDLRTVVDICDDLQKRGEIKVDDNALQPG